LIKRVIVNFLVIAVFIGVMYTNIANILQLNRVIPEFFLVMPDIFLILTVFNGIFYGSFYAMVFGFLSGLALDISTYPLIGFYSLIYTTIGYSISIIEKKMDFENSVVSTLLIIGYFLFKILIFVIVGAIFLKTGEIKNYFANIFVMQFVYTILLSIPIFKIYRMNSLKVRKSY